jgi:hypothetical protein
MATVRFEPKDNGKRLAVAALFLLSTLVILAGVGFGVYSFANHVSYAVLGSSIPGPVIAAVVVFLGVRYLLSVIKLNKRLAGFPGSFSWKNFKLNKTKKMEG